jgi:hypothetical protein
VELFWMPALLQPSQDRFEHQQLARRGALALGGMTERQRRAFGVLKDKRLRCFDRERLTATPGGAAEFDRAAATALEQRDAQMMSSGLARGRDNPARPL